MTQQTFIQWAVVELGDATPRFEIWKGSAEASWAYMIRCGGGNDIMRTGFASEGEARRAATQQAGRLEKVAQSLADKA